MKVIFLDIDGVMNSQLFYEARHKMRWFKPKTYYWKIKSKIKWVFNGFEYKPISLANYKHPKKFDKFEYKFKRLKEYSDSLKWEWLVELCDETDAKICVSSVWKRHFKNNDEWNKALMRFGFNDGTFVGITGDRRTLRGTEIKEWIDKNQPIEKYVIIDDDSDMLPEQKESFFQTDGYCGLTPNTCYKIKRYLNK